MVQVKMEVQAAHGGSGCMCAPTSAGPLSPRQKERYPDYEQARRRGGQGREKLTWWQLTYEVRAMMNRVRPQYDIPPEPKTDPDSTHGAPVSVPVTTVRVGHLMSTIYTQSTVQVPSHNATIKE